MLLLLAAQLACPLDQARYVLREDPSVTAQFHQVPSSEDWPAGVAMKVHLGKTGRSFWWLPTMGGSSGRRGFRWVPERGATAVAPDRGYTLGDIEYFAFWPDYRYWDGRLMRGRLAPGHLFMPELGYQLWYRTPSNQRDQANKGFFDLTGCDSEAVNAPPPPDLVFPPVP